MDYKTGIYAVVRSYTATFYLLEKDNFNKIYSFETKGIFAFAFDHQVANKKVFSFIAHNSKDGIS